MNHQRNKKPGVFADTGLSIPRMAVQPSVTSADLAIAVDYCIRVARVSTLALTATFDPLLPIVCWDWTLVPHRRFGGTQKNHSVSVMREPAELFLARQDSRVLRPLAGGCGRVTWNYHDNAVCRGEATAAVGGVRSSRH